MKRQKRYYALMAVLLAHWALSGLLVLLVIAGAAWLMRG